MCKEKRRYAILRAIEEKNLSEIERTLMNNELQAFDDTLRFLDREGYVMNVSYSDDRPEIDDFIEITEKGEIYLKENSNLKKLYNGLKELRDWIN